MEVSSCRRVVPFHQVPTEQQASSCCRAVPFHQVPTAKQLRQRTEEQMERPLGLISTMKALSLTSNGPLTSIEGPSTSKGPLTSTEGPSTPPNGPLTSTEGPSIHNGPLTSIEGPSTPPNGPLTSTEGPCTPNGPLTSTEGPSTPNGPLTSIEGPSTPPNGPLTSIEGPSTPPNGPLTSTEGPSTPNGPLTSIEGPSTPPNGSLTSIEGPSTPPNGPLTSIEGPSTPPNGPLTSTEGPSTPNARPHLARTEEQEEVAPGPFVQDVPFVPVTAEAVRPAKRKRRPPPLLQDFVLGLWRVAPTSTGGPCTPSGPLARTEEERVEKVTSGPLVRDVPFVPVTAAAVRPAKRKRRPPPHLHDFVLRCDRSKGNAHADQLVPHGTPSSLEEGLVETRRPSTLPGTPEPQRTAKRTRRPPAHLQDFFMLD